MSSNQTREDNLETGEQCDPSKNLESSKTSLKEHPQSTNDDSRKTHEQRDLASGRVHPHPQSVHSERKSPSSSSSASSPSSRKERAKRFSQLVKEAQQKLKLRGIEEISDSHWLYPMATAIRRGLLESQKSYDQPVDIVSTEKHDGE